VNRQLVALLAHDLKNQLGLLEAELAALSPNPDPAAAVRAHQHCAQLRQRLVAYLTLYGGGGAGGRLSAQLVDESPQDFLLSLQHIASRPPLAPLQVLPAPAGLPPFWYFDARLLRLALEAALHNAWRFARHEVCLSVAAHDGGLEFRVDDDGPGPGSPDPSAQSSTGLGMQLCAAVARAHRRDALRGRVSLLPRPQGGTRFALWLP